MNYKLLFLFFKDKRSNDEADDSDIQKYIRDIEDGKIKNSDINEVPHSAQSYPVNQISKCSR